MYTSSQLTRSILPKLLLLLLLAGAAAGCKPTEKNYRSAYDVARDKRERDLRQQEQLRADMGIGGSEIHLSDTDATLATIGERQVWTHHLNFPRADSVATYAVSVALFRMDTNAKALAADLRAQGWPETRASHSADSYFVIVGSSDSRDRALELLDSFQTTHPEWQYVGQPGILLLIGGSR